MHRLDHLLPDGWAERSRLAAAASPSSVERWLRTGALAQVQPRIVAVPEWAGNRVLRASTATAWAGGPLSHVSALRAAGLLPVEDGPIHVTVTPDRCPRDGSGSVVHRSDRRLITVRYGPLEATAPERSLVAAGLGRLAR